MEAQARLLADLTAAISSMRAKLDVMYPAVLDLNSWRPVESLRAEVRDPRSRIIDTSYAISVDAASPAIVEEGPEVGIHDSTGYTTTTPANCSMESTSRDTTKSRSAPATATAGTPTTTIADVNLVLLATSASNQTISGEAISGAGTTHATYSTVCPSSDASALVSALVPSATTTWCMALEVVHHTAPTPPEVATTQLLKSSMVIDLNVLAPSKCSAEFLVNGTADTTTHMDNVVSHEKVEVEALAMADIICVDPGDHRQPPWPPPQIFTIRLSCWDSSNRSQTELKPWHGEPQYQCTPVIHPWPPLCENSSLQELQEILGHAASFELQDCSSNGLRETINAPESRLLQVHGYPLPPLGFFIAKDQSKASMKWCCNDLLSGVTNPFGSEYEVTSIPMQMTVRSLELNLFLSSSAPSFLMTNYLDGGPIAAYLNLDAGYTSFWFRTTHRTSHDMTFRLCPNLLTPLTCLRILVFTTISLQSSFGSVMDIALKHSSFFQHTTKSLASAWDSGQPQGVRKYSVVPVFTFTSSGNVEVQETIELMDIPVHGQFLRKEEFEGSGIYASVNLTIEVLITWSLPSIYGFNTTNAQSSNGTTCSEMVCYNQGQTFGLRSLLALQGSAYYSLSDRTCESDWKQGCGEFSQADHSENVAHEPLSKLEPDDVAFFLSFLLGQDLARYQCNTRALAPNMQILFETRLTYVVPVYTAMRIEMPKDMSSIKRLQVVNMLILWMSVDFNDKANQNKKSWRDLGGCMLALCNREKWWTASEPTPLHCFDQLHWLSLLLAYASRIRLVAWAGNDLAAGYVQAHFSGGGNFMNQAIFSDQVHVGHDYYTAFVNKISVGYDYYLDQVYYFDTFCSDFIYFGEDHHGDLDKIKEVHTPWDPGKLAFRYPPKTSAWGQADFQGGRNVMTLACVPLLGPVPWANNGGLSPIELPGASTYMHQEATASW